MTDAQTNRIAHLDTVIRHAQEIQDAIRSGETYHDFGLIKLYVEAAEFGVDRDGRFPDGSSMHG